MSENQVGGHQETKEAIHTILDLLKKLRSLLIFTNLKFPTQVIHGLITEQMLIARLKNTNYIKEGFQVVDLSSREKERERKAEVNTVR